MLWGQIDLIHWCQTSHFSDFQYLFPMLSTHTRIDLSLFVKSGPGVRYLFILPFVDMSNTLGVTSFLISTEP